MKYINLKDKVDFNNLPSLEELNKVQAEMEEELLKLYNSQFYKDNSSNFNMTDEIKPKEESDI